MKEWNIRTIRYQGNEGMEHRNNPVSYMRKQLREKEF